MQLHEPIKQILKDTRPIWDRDSTRPRKLQEDDRLQNSRVGLANLCLGNRGKVRLSHM